ncbi:hypothetical protein ACFX11_009219 [Malus domestica]
MYVTMGVTFFEHEMFFITDHIHYNLQKEMSTQEDYSWIDFSTYQLRDTCQHDFCHRDNIGKQGQQQPNHVGLSNLELSNLGKPILGLPSSDYRESASGLMSSNGSESFTQPSMQSNESEGFT